MNHEPEHYGKAAIAVVEDKVTITIDCATCGRVVLGPIEVVHLGSLADLLQNVCEKMGVPKGRSEVVSHICRVTTPRSSKKGMKEFEDMPVGPEPANGIKNLWGLLGGKVH